MDPGFLKSVVSSKTISQKGLKTKVYTFYVLPHKGRAG